MAQVGARPLPSLSTPTVNSGHASSGARSVANVTSAPIEEIGVKAEVQSDPFSFADAFGEGQQRRRRDAQPLKNTASHFETPSATFAFLLGQEQKEEAAEATITNPKFSNVLNKAIAAYETTARVISGNAGPLGASISFSL